MSKGRRDTTTVRHDSKPQWLLFLALATCVLGGCQTVKPDNNVLEGLQEWVTPEPIDRLSPPHEQADSKAAMVRWLERYLDNKYRVIDQRFVLTEPGFTEGSRIGSKANQYVKQTLGGVARPGGWYDDDSYRLLFWTFGDGSKRCIAFAMTRDFLPDTQERRLVGYFELKPSAHGRN